MRIAHVHRFEAEPEPVHRARPEVLDQDVHAIDQAKTEVEAVGLLEVDRDAALAPVESEEEACKPAGEGRSPAAAHVSGARFELVDLGAVVGQEQRAVGSGEGVREVEDVDAVEGRSHRLPSYSGAAGCATPPGRAGELWYSVWECTKRNTRPKRRMNSFV
jgi:hypothetical protein